MLVLASSSPRRRALLRLLTDDFVVDAPDVDEALAPGDALLALQGVAARKARVVQARHPGAVVLAADTAIIHAGEVIGKPQDRGDARRILLRLDGHAHDVVTALAVSTGPVVTQAVVSKVCIDLGAGLDAYLASGAWQGKAGAYGLQDPASPATLVDGPWSNVVGLPLAATRTLLEAAGVACAPAPDEATLHQNPFDPS